MNGKQVGQDGGLKLGSMLDSFLAEMNMLLEDLENKIGVLPKVDENGSSECPFAEDLYTAKEEAEEKVREALPTLCAYQSILEDELDRCRTNLERISLDAQSINMSTAKDHYGRAESLQEAQYRRVDLQRAAVAEMIARGNKALAESATKKFPGREPQRRTPSSPLPERMHPRGTASPYRKGFQSHASSFPETRENPIYDELESLFSIGPMPGAQSKR